MRTILPDVSMKTLIRFLWEYEYREFSKNENYIHYFSYSHRKMVTIPIKEKIVGKLLESILKQANISETCFIEYLKSITKIKVKPSAIAFVDILGFRDKMESLKSDKSNLNKLLNDFNKVLKPAISSLEYESKSQRKFDSAKMCYVRIFTDNIVFMTELTDMDEEAEIASMIHEISFYQFNLATKGFFSRGAIVSGDSYCDEKLIFGNPIVTAYELEKKAIYPRIILDQSIIEKIEIYSSWYDKPETYPFFSNVFLEDSDENWFINYLYINKSFNDDEINYLRRHDPDNPICQCNYHPVAIKALEEHKKHIIINIQKFKSDKSGILKKYEWLTKYHDFFCSNYFASEKSLLIDTASSVYGFKYPFNNLFK